jgi:hypothetical protein
MTTGYSVGDVSRIAHVTVRTLHHYDEIGLLRPGTRTEAGYRRNICASRRQGQGDAPADLPLNRPNFGDAPAHPPTNTLPSVAQARHRPLIDPSTPGGPGMTRHELRPRTTQPSASATDHRRAAISHANASAALRSNQPGPRTRATSSQ